MNGKIFAAAILASVLAAATPFGSVYAQQQEPSGRPAADTSAAPPPADAPASAKRTVDEPGVSARPRFAETEAGTAASEEETGVIPYYKNFFSSYRLGPEDVISVTVFGQERYSKGNITIPPDGRISYPLIPDGLIVAGKTTVEVQNELTKKLDEYIIDPKITVSIDQAKSTRYSVLGDVAAPGVKPMMRRLTVREAIAEAGGVLSTGNKKKVQVLRPSTSGIITPIRVDIAAIEKGRAADDLYLRPGDQIIVPGNTFKKVKEVLGYASILSFATYFFRF